MKANDRISFEVLFPIDPAISRGRSGDTADDFIGGHRHFDKDASSFMSLSNIGREFNRKIANENCNRFVYKKKKKRKHMLNN